MSARPVSGKGARLGLAAINDNRQIAHRHFDKILRSVTSRRIEEKRVARFHQIGAVGVPIFYFAREHVDELDPSVTKVRVGLGVLFERDQIRLDRDWTAKRMAKKIVEMASLGAAPFDAHTATGLHKGAVPTFVGFSEQATDRHVERLGES